MKSAIAFLVLMFLNATVAFSQVHIKESAVIGQATDTTNGSNSQLLEKWKELTKNAV